MIHYRLSFDVLKATKEDLTEEAYLGSYEKLRQYEVPGDPNVVFDHDAKTIAISHYGEDLMVHYPSLARDLKDLYKDAMGSTPQILDQLFITPDADRRKAAFLTDSRDALRTLRYQDVPAGTSELVQAQSDAQNLRAVANSGAGVSFGGGHGDKARHQVMMDLLKAPEGLGNLRLFFIEELGVGDQRLVDQYLSSAAETKLPPALEKRIGSIHGMSAMLAEMRDYNLAHGDAPVRAYGINTAEAKMRSGKMGPETRVAMMNATAKEVMDDVLHQHPDQKFVAFVGAAHSNTHAGGIPGISQIYGVPAVVIDEKGRLALDDEDKTLRGMPSREALGRIEKALEASKSQSTKEHVEALARLVQADRKQAFDQLGRAGKKAYPQDWQGLNVPLTDQEIAEIVVIQSEDAALQKGGEPADTADVNAKKHGKLIEKLIKRLGQLTEENKRDPQALITGLVEAVSKDDIEAFYLKPKRDPANHVSIKPDAAKKEWLAKLNTLGQQT